jgi:hypothetical protein
MSNSRIRELERELAVERARQGELPWQIVRSTYAGVFAGFVESRDGTEAVVRQARRLWFWKGAASLSELATRGPAAPSECKFSEPVDRELVLAVCEILDVTPEARASIENVPVWSAHESKSKRR